jgi:hypothetical protein
MRMKNVYLLRSDSICSGWSLKYSNRPKFKGCHCYKGSLPIDLADMLISGQFNKQIAAHKHIRAVENNGGKFWEEIYS